MKAGPKGCGEGKGYSMNTKGPSRYALIRAMQAKGLSLSEVAKQLGPPETRRAIQRAILRHREGGLRKHPRQRRCVKHGKKG